VRFIRLCRSLVIECRELEGTFCAVPKRRRAFVSTEQPVDGLSPRADPWSQVSGYILVREDGVKMECIIFVKVEVGVGAKDAIVNVLRATKTELLSARGA
jgi:hypothetical protein